MGNVLLMNSMSQEMRVVLVENGVIRDVYVERKTNHGTVGNIYKGKVVRILPGMQAAFVDIGQGKAAFLYVSDVYNQHEAYMQEVEADAFDEGEVPQSRGPGRMSGPIEERLREGQDILVQISKESIGTKGARITSHISIPGRFLVYMPTFDHLGISRRIESEAQRMRLKDLITERRLPGTGVIVRTACESASDRQIISDFDFLSQVWQGILDEFDRRESPSLLYEELDLTLRAARDLLSDGIEEIVIDSQREYERVVEFAKKYMPNQVSNIRLYNEAEPIFDAYGVEMELTRALARKVWLRSGGYLIIDVTEALTVIDVNSGKFVGKNSLEETILQTNLEAVAEIAYQLKVRNIGGIIVIDFIDMEKSSNRERVYNALEEALKNDRAKTSVQKIGDFGVIEMTRKRVRESLIQSLCEPCFYCEGRGYVRSRYTVAYEILRRLRRDASIPGTKELHVTAHPDVAHLIYDAERISVEELEHKTKVKVLIRGNINFHIEHYEIDKVK